MGWIVQVRNILVCVVSGLYGEGNEKRQENLGSMMDMISYL